MTTEQTHVHIIGAGAAGLLAAIAAANAGARVTILEKMPRPAQKLRITGNGRCNLSTLDTAAQAAAAFGPGGKFLRGAFSRFFSAELVALIESIGVPVTSEPGRGYYPRSNRAGDVADALAANAASLGAELLTGKHITALCVTDGRITGIVAGEETIPASRVVLATGGASYQRTGSTGDGWRIASALGHTVSPPLPSCVPLMLEGDLHVQLAPLTFPNVAASLTVDGKTAAKSSGGILFTPWGATGPAALALGKTVAASKGSEMWLIVNFLPGMDAAAAAAMLAARFAASGRAAAPAALDGLFPKRAVAAIIDHWDVPPGRWANQVTASERAQLAALCVRCAFPVRGTKPIAEAMVTAGGVSLREISPKTMESKIVRGLFICGELLDLDAGTGGYNLQAAFSTGFVAGSSAAAM